MKMSSSDDFTPLIDPDDSSSDESADFLSKWENYRIESVLGEGGMARVYKAFEPKLKRYVALKFIRSENENLKKRQLREARSQAQIEHDHVCKIYEVGEVDGKSYIAMQLIQGDTLQDCAEDMSVEQKVLAIQQVSDAVQAAHRLGIIHRDIKPTNIMVERREDGSFRPYIMDFGIAREISDPGQTAANVVIGTPAYMAPEQASGDPTKVDRRVDVYGLGATLYHVLSGKRPFLGTGMDVLVELTTKDPVPLKKVFSSVPEDLDIIVSKCLEKDPARRYDSARGLADDLKRYLEGEPIFARRATLRYRLAKKIQKNRTLSALIALSFVVIVASAGFSAYSYLRTARRLNLERQLSRSVEAMDWMMRVAHMAPLHDIRKETAQVLTRMQEIERIMKEAGSAGTGPGNLALGRGSLALQDYEMARSYLERAWNSGYREKEVAGALGLALGALYKRQLSEANRISDKESRERRLQALEKEYRYPAVAFLRTGSGSGSQTREYGEALLSYYEKDWEKALSLARLSAEKSPWFYEALLLEGDVYSQMGEETFQQGKYDDAKKQFESAADLYRKAEDISRSDSAVYENQCSLWRAVMEVQFDVGEDAGKSYQNSNEACKKAMIANSDSATPYEFSAQTAWRWGENQFEAGEDPTAAFDQAILLSRRAQKLSPDHSYAYYTLGTTFGYLADYQVRLGKDPTESLEQSITALKLAVKKDPGFGPAYGNLGVSYFSQGALAMERGEDPESYYRNAIEAYEKALEINPRNLAARSNIANTYTNLSMDAMNKGSDPTGYFQKAVENFKKALELNPNHWLIHSNLSNVYIQQTQYQLDHGKDPTETIQKVLFECRESARLKADNPYSAINTANAYLGYAEYALAKNEDPSQWIEKMESSVSHLMGDDFSEVPLTLAAGQRIKAEYATLMKLTPVSALERSKRFLDECYRVNSTEQLIPIERARLELVRAEWLFLNHQSPEAALASAAAHARGALDLNPRSAQAYLILGKASWKKMEWLHPENKEITEGLSDLERSLKLNPDLAETYAVRAHLLLLSGRSGESIQDFERAFKINPWLRSREQLSFEQAKSLK